MRLRVGLRRARRKRRDVRRKARQRVRHRHVRQCHVARVQRHDGVGDHVAHAVVTRRRRRLAYRQRRVLHRGHRRVVGRGGDRIARTVLARGNRGVHHAARVHVRLGDGVDTGAGEGAAGGQGGGRGGAVHRRNLVVNHGERPVKRHIAVVRDKVTVAYGLSNRGVNHRVRALYQRQRRPGNRTGDKLRVRVGHGLAVRILSGHRRRVREGTRVNVRLGDGVTGAEGRAVRHAGGQGCQRAARHHRVRIGNRDVVQRHIAGVGHGEGVGEHITHHGIAGLVSRLRKHDGGVLDRRHRLVVRVAHRVAVLIQAGGRSRVRHASGVQIRLGDGVCLRVQLGRARREGRDGVGEARQRVRDHDIRQRHVARVRHGYRVGDHIAHAVIARRRRRFCDVQRRGQHAAEDAEVQGEYCRFGDGHRSRLEHAGARHAAKPRGLLGGCGIHLPGGKRPAQARGGKRPHGVQQRLVNNQLRRVFTPRIRLAGPDAPVAKKTDDAGLLVAVGARDPDVGAERVADAALVQLALVRGAAVVAVAVEVNPLPFLEVDAPLGVRHIFSHKAVSVGVEPLVLEAVVVRVVPDKVTQHRQGVGLIGEVVRLRITGLKRCEEEAGTRRIEAAGAVQVGVLHLHEVVAGGQAVEQVGPVRAGDLQKHRTHRSALGHKRHGHVRNRRQGTREEHRAGNSRSAVADGCHRFIVRVRHRRAARGRARRTGGVHHAARVNLGAADGDCREERRGLARDKACDGFRQARQRIRDQHVGQGHGAGVPHLHRVGDHIANRRVNRRGCGLRDRYSGGSGGDMITVIVGEGFGNRDHRHRRRIRALRLHRAGREVGIRLVDISRCKADRNLRRPVAKGVCGDSLRVAEAVRDNHIDIRKVGLARILNAVVVHIQVQVADDHAAKMVTVIVGECVNPGNGVHCGGIRAFRLDCAGREVGIRLVYIRLGCARRHLRRPVAQGACCGGPRVANAVRDDHIHARKIGLTQILRAVVVHIVVQVAAHGGDDEVLDIIIIIRHRITVRIVRVHTRRVDQRT